jgi:hypothetical protein
MQAGQSFAGVDDSVYGVEMYRARGRWAQERTQFAYGSELGVDPFVVVALLENHGHAAVDRAEQFVRFGCDDRESEEMGFVESGLLFPKARKGERLTILQDTRMGCLVLPCLNHS